jgi:hypothetical protein
MAMVSGDWRGLRVGDRIRFVSMPTGFSSNNCHEETLEAYRTLIARRRPVRVSKFDEFNMPWIQFRVQLSDGRWNHHSLLINHDGWVRVRSRPAPT